MKLLAVFILAMAAAVNVEAEVQKYVVPIYRVSMVATTTTTTTTSATTTTTETSSKPSPRGRVVVSPKGINGYNFVHVCSGTLVDQRSIITTVSCIELAMLGGDKNAHVATAADKSSLDDNAKVLYEVSKVVKHPEYDSATNANNIAVLTLSIEVDYNLGPVLPITWSEAVPALEAKCVASYWDAATTFEQDNQAVTVKACVPSKPGTICSDYPAHSSECPAGANGASLVCDSKLAGIFTAHRNADCDAALWQYEEISKDAAWIWESINAAPILNVSFAAILALVTAMLKSL